jgi:hypothetical protein
VFDQGERAHVQRGRQRHEICVETTSKEYVRTSLARVRWKGGCAGQGHAARMGMLAHPGYAATCARRQGYTGV